MQEIISRRITHLLVDWNNGDEFALEQLMPLVYVELRKMARRHMRAQPSGHTLETTDLIHEAYLKIARSEEQNWQNRAHFFGVASRAMRQILVDHARVHAAAKRGSGPIHFSLDDIDVPVAERARSIIMLNDALETLEKVDEQQARVVEMRFFGGMNIAEIAQALAISERTVSREWEAARLWLYLELDPN